MEPATRQHAWNMYRAVGEPVTLHLRRLLLLRCLCLQIEENCARSAGR